MDQALGMDEDGQAEKEPDLDFGVAQERGRGAVGGGEDERGDPGQRHQSQGQAPEILERRAEKSQPKAQAVERPARDQRENGRRALVPRALEDHEAPTLSWAWLAG